MLCLSLYMSGRFERSKRLHRLGQAIQEYYLPNHTASRPGTLESSAAPQWERHISHLSNHHHHHHHHHHWHNSPFWAKAFFRSSRQLSLSLAAFLQFLSPNFLAYSITPSSHLGFGLPLCLLPSTTATMTLLVGLCSSKQITCPAHFSRLLLMLCYYINFLMSHLSNIWRKLRSLSSRDRQ